jgi:dephospho-CoA kinase
MPLVYITGNSGAGKSAVRKELILRGYEAHDTDENDISSWQNKYTGNIVERPLIETDRTNAWYSEHDWNMSRNKIDNLAKQANDKLIFLCGSTSNADEMLGFFNKVYYLSVDKDTLKERLTSRTSNDFGKAPDELNNILGWHMSLEERYKNHGAHLIDATQPINSIVDEILSTLD